MSSNDQVLLENVLQQRRIEVAPDMSASDFFEYFRFPAISRG